MAVEFVPLTVAAPLLDLKINGGRGLLWIADLDTVFIDTATVAILVLLWKRRAAIQDGGALVAFGLFLSSTTAILLGYVVTNFGTLWRMRPLVMVPLWLLVLAMSPRTIGRMQQLAGGEATTAVRVPDASRA
jgi:hypothetical protein